MPDNRNLLKDVVAGFTTDGIQAYLRNASENFRSSEHDFDDYLKDDDIFSSISSLGEIEYPDGRRLIAVQAVTPHNLTSRTGRKRQYDIGKKILKENSYDAGIFIFHDQSGRFRFSLITAVYSGTKRTFGPYKRYTYYIDPELPNKTFINQVGRADFSGIDDLLAAFSIEAVSNDFYNAFKPKFDALAGAVISDTKDNAGVKEDFVLLFVMRVIFLGFVQKKKWLGDNDKFMQDFWHEYKTTRAGKEEFYTRWLVPLFFEALNSPPGRPVKYRNNEFSDAAQKTLNNAPYLNGELFKEKRGYDTVGLSIPDQEIGAFFDFLFQYNFTIEENQSYDEELELNPEFLGIIFERLVNKADGAVYTPRIEVDMMCRLALVKWLEKNSTCEKRDLYHLLFREGGPGAEFDEEQKRGDFSTKEIRELVGLLERVTVCDPAAGSGAFEVGMLHVLNDTFESLMTNRPRLPEDLALKTPFERKEAIIANSLYGVEVKQWAVWINQLRLWLTLFVDMPDDHKSSQEPLLPSLNFKVRCGDSLVQRIGSKMFPVQGHADLSKPIKKRITELKKHKVDFFYNRGKGYDFIKAQENGIFLSILEEEITVKKRKMVNLSEYKAEQTNLFGPDQPGQTFMDFNEKEKIRLKREIDELREEKRNLSDEHPLVWNIEFAEIFFDRGGFDIIIGNPPYVRQEDIADPVGKLAPKDYKEALRSMAALDFPRHFDGPVKIDGKSDLYTFFYVRSLRLLNETGVHVFICSNSWLDVGYGVWMQYFLLKNVPMHLIVDNHNRRSFSSADINTIITVMGAPEKRIDPECAVRFVAFKRPFEEAVLSDNLIKIDNAQGILKDEVFRVFTISGKNLLEEGSEYESEEQRKLGAGTYLGDKWGGKYLRAPDIFFSILNEAKGKIDRLGDYVTILPGCYTGINDFFYVTDDVISKYNLEAGYLVPLLRSSRSISGLRVEPKSDYVISIGPIPKSKLKPNIAKYICWGENQVTRKRQKTKAGIPWPQTESVKNRRYWYSIPSKNLIGTRLFMQYVASDRFYCPFSKRDLVSDRCFHRIFPDDEKNYIALSLLLNSTIQMFFVMLLGRTGLGQGALKFEACDARRIYVLKPDILADSANKEILDRLGKRIPKSVFEECGLDPNSNIPISEQDPNPLSDRMELDEIVFNAIDLSEVDRKDVYRAVCQLVWDRISKAKSVKKRR